jgi:DNA-binding CsgD family transcriptional regulator
MFVSANALSSSRDVARPDDVGAGAGPDWTSLLEAMGTHEFEPVMKQFLCALVGPQACAAFLHEATGDLVMGCHHARTGHCSQPTCLRESQQNSSPHWIHFKDGPWHAAIAVALPGPVQWNEASDLSRRLAATGGALAAILRKHIDAAYAPTEPTEPLASLSTIEQRIAKSTDMPNREVEVCSRILYGLSSAGIAIDLDICETTVKTYRKRAYHRLSIGCERELLTWYLRKWTQRPG